MSRLSPLDVSNLRVEDCGAPMHIAALAILENGQLGSDTVREDVARRLHVAPRLRQVLYRPRVGLGPPVWVDDPGFDLRRHVRSCAVPAPGDEAATVALCARLNEPPLDRSRPLWEMWLLTGLADGTVGLLIRLHHAAADGIAALALLGALFDTAPVTPPPSPMPWEPRPRPGAWQLFADNVYRKSAALSGLRPGRFCAFVRQLRHVAREGFTPRVSLNRPVGPHRRLRLVRGDLAWAKAIAHAHGATVNDVVLAAVAGGARRLLDARGELKPGMVLKASVAMSVRGSGEPVTGNRVAAMVAPLPVGEPDPVHRLEQIARATAEAKQQPPYLPSTRMPRRWVAYAMSHQRLVNLLVSNVPGPPEHLYFAGARVREVFGVGVLQGNIPVAVGVLSYAGQLNVDIVSDADVDAAPFGDGLCEALDELGAARDFGTPGRDFGLSITRAAHPNTEAGRRRENSRGHRDRAH